MNKHELLNYLYPLTRKERHHIKSLHAMGMTYVEILEIIKDDRDYMSKPMVIVTKGANGPETFHSITHEWDIYDEFPPEPIKHRNFVPKWEKAQ